MANLTLHLFFQNPARIRNKELLTHVKDNMKLYRSFNCRVMVWLNKSERECELLRKQENYPFNIRPVQEAKRMIVESIRNASSSDQVRLMRNNETVLELVPLNEEERFDTKRLVSSLVT